MGVAAGDFNNDGWVDIYRTGLHGGVMLRNNGSGGDGTFTDVTRQTGTGDGGDWGVSASFVDYDRDGWLDLFVGNYLIYSLDADVRCLSVTGQRDYCPPNSYRARPSRLYHNRGNGTFEDVTARALVGGAYGPALGVATTDFDNDGWIDLYVANDGQPNQLWINQRNGTFKDTAFVSGSAVNSTGNATASMGVDAADFDNDGDDDLIITNWLDQMNTLFVNDGTGNFEDRKAPSGLGLPSLAKTGFGTGWLDFDNDGWLDLFVANGSVSTIEAQARAKEPFPLRMTNQLYRNLGNGRFEDVSSGAGSVFAIADVGRGAAFGDVDNDGRTDILIGSASGPVRLLVNRVQNDNHWLGLRLVGQGPPGTRGTQGTMPRGRDMVGARVEVVRPGTATLVRRARADGSYASANDPRVLIGLGPQAERAARPRPLARRSHGRVARRRHRSMDDADGGLGQWEVSGAGRACSSACAMCLWQSSIAGLTASCSAPRSAEAPGRSLLPVSLPELTRVDAGVEQQVRQRYASLTERISQFEDERSGSRHRVRRARDGASRGGVLRRGGTLLPERADACAGGITLALLPRSSLQEQGRHQSLRRRLRTVAAVEAG